MSVLPEGRCLLIEAQGTEQTLCRSWEKLTRKGLPVPPLMSQGEVALPEGQASGARHLRGACWGQRDSVPLYG